MKYDNGLMKKTLTGEVLISRKLTWLLVITPPDSLSREGKTKNLPPV